MRGRIRADGRAKGGCAATSWRERWADGGGGENGSGMSTSLDDRVRHCISIACTRVLVDRGVGKDALRRSVVTHFC